MDTRSILSKKISFCSNIRTKNYRSITLFEALNSIRTNVYYTQIKNIQKFLSTGNIKSYRAKKKQLPAFIFAGIAYGERHKFDISGYTHLLIVDIDKLENSELAKSLLVSDEYVLAVWASPSGNGLKALFYIEFEGITRSEEIWILHEYCAFPQISNYLSEKYDIQIDQSGSDITRLCFVSADSNIYLKKEFEPFKIQTTLNKKQVWKIRAQYYYGSKEIRKRVNEMKRLSKLLNSTTEEI